MNQLVVHHPYIAGSTFDVSPFHNNGLPTAVTPGSGAYAGSFRFDQPTSGIMVKVSPSLRDLTAIRARVKFRLEPQSSARYNIMEGFVSFALYVHPDRSLQGTIVDRSGNWVGPHSAPNTIVAGRWHEVQFAHDGISRARITLDGVVVAERTDVYGPVRSIGPLGLAIGRWPDTNAYVFQGYIGELQLWRFHPLETIDDLLDRCCVPDLEATGGVIARYRERGQDWSAVAASARKVQALLIELTQLVRERGGSFDGIDARLLLALLRRDTHLAALRRRAAEILSAALGREETARMTVIAEAAHLGTDDLVALARALCLGNLVPPSPWPPHDRRPDDRQRKPSDVAVEESGPWDNVRPPTTSETEDDVGGAGRS